MRYGFWPLALLWLPAGFAVQAAIRFAPETASSAEPATWLPAALQSLVVTAPFGLPLALGCRRLWRSGRRRTAWAAGIGLGAATVAAGLLAGLLGPFAVAVCAVLLSLPVWIAGCWPVRRYRSGSL